MSVEGFTKPFRDKIIFAPLQITGRTMFLWTLDWKSPFRIANFLYLTDDNTKFWFVKADADTSINELLAMLPNSTNSQIIEPGLAIQSDFKKNRVIFVGGNQNWDAIKNLPGVSALWIDEGWTQLVFKWGENLNSGLTWPPQGSDTISISKEHLLGAIFSEEGDLYRCQMNTANSRLKTITSIYKQRATNLSTMPEYARCDESYIKAGAGPPGGITFETANEQLLLASCPAIY